MNKSEMNEELKRLKAENQELQEQVDIEKVVNQQIKIESNKMIKHLSERNRSLTREIHQLKGKIHRITEKNYTLTEKFESVQAKDETPSSKFKSRQPKDVTSSSEADKAEKSIEGLNIKVLNGDGKPNSAAKMAKRIRDFGYNIKLIGDAPKSTFRINTLFFAAHAEHDAKRLESRIGVPLILKPLSWSSKFDLIVVTGSKK